MCYTKFSVYKNLISKWLIVSLGCALKKALFIHSVLKAQSACAYSNEPPCCTMAEL